MVQYFRSEHSSVVFSDWIDKFWDFAFFRAEVILKFEKITKDGAVAQTNFKLWIKFLESKFLWN